MRKILIVLKYELKEYFSSKGFMIATLAIAALAAIALCIPRVMDMVKSGEKDTVVEETTENAEDMDIFYLLDQSGVVDLAVLEAYFPEVNWLVAENEDALIEAVESQEAEAGFVVKSVSEYDYYVFNKSMYDSNSEIFTEAMKGFYRTQYCVEHNLDINEITQIFNTEIVENTEVLNKDSGDNYWYCYMLVIVVWVLIMLYGQMIAVSVTNEKSNRAIEVLVTSTTPNSLLFGKVFAGAIAGLFQAGVVMGAILISYQCNKSYWGGMLDMIFDIPVSVLLTFAVFGMGGYLFYAFLFGAMGALVSKTEDVSKSSNLLVTITMIVYFLSLFQLTNVDGVVIKVLSFLPFSSYCTMFARIAMGTVAIWEVILSVIILIASIIGAGILGAKIYRMGTLRYGNPIKLSAALKAIRKED